MSLIVKAKAVIPDKKKTYNSVNRVSREEYHWTKVEGGFVVLFPQGDFARLSPIDGQWQYEGSFHGVETIGRRPTLKEGFSAIDSLIHRMNKELWVKTRCHEVLKEFSGFDDLEDDLGDLP